MLDVRVDLAPVVAAQHDGEIDPGQHLLAAAVSPAAAKVSALANAASTWPRSYPRITTVNCAMRGSLDRPASPSNPAQIAVRGSLTDPQPEGNPAQIAMRGSLDRRRQPERDAVEDVVLEATTEDCPERSMMIRRISAPPDHVGPARVHDR